MAKLCILILWSIVFAGANGVEQSPKGVEDWLSKLKGSKEKVSKLHFYYHDSRHPEKNLSAVQVAKAPVYSEQPPFFGVVTIVDDPLTVGGEISSRRVDYAQGLYATSSLEEEVSLLMALTFVFTDGSTLAVLGRNTIGDRYRELPVVGGTGVFRLARGIVTLQTYFYNFTMGLAIVEVNVVILHY